MITKFARLEQKQCIIWAHLLWSGLRATDYCSRERNRESFTAREVNFDNCERGSHSAFLHVFYSWIQQVMRYRESNSRRVEQPRAKGEGQWIIEKVLSVWVRLFPPLGSIAGWCRVRVTWHRFLFRMQSLTFFVWVALGVKGKVHIYLS